jgi:transcriptional regulator with XRE-family HTH domain
VGGRRLGLIRARKKACFTQESLAQALNVDPTTVGHWERGRTEPLPYKRPKLAKLLGVGSERLEELLAEGQAEPLPSAPAEPDRELMVTEVASDPMKRRTLMKWGIATTAASGLGIEVLGHIGMADVRRLERTTDRLCNLDHRHGGETLWRAGAATAQEAAAMLEHGRYSTSVGQVLLGAAGSLYVRTGWLACDAGRHDVARSSFTEALSISRQAGDAEIETRALAGLGFHSNLVGRPREGLRFGGSRARCRSGRPGPGRAVRPRCGRGRRRRPATPTSRAGPAPRPDSRPSRRAAPAGASRAPTSPHRARRGLRSPGRGRSARRRRLR